MSTTTKWIFVASVAALAVAGGFYVTKAKAADLGSAGCCSDLEERVAELEATTTRKGNRKVKLTVSGYVSHSIMMWDDGDTRNTYIGDGGMNTSRFRFTGEAKVSPQVTAGFTYEFGINNNNIGAANQLAGGDDLGGAVSLRDSTVWMRHASLGRIKIGHGSTATDNLILIDATNATYAASPDVGLWNGGFFLNSTLAGGLTPLTWANILNQGVSFDTARRNHVMYESPSLGGFVMAAAIAEDSFWDIALRYAGEFGGFRMAFGIGYSNDAEAPTFHPVPALGFGGIAATDLKEYKGSASLMHVQTGLFVNVAAGQREIDWSLTGGGAELRAEDPQWWHVMAGIERNWFGIGATTLYAEYHEAKDMVGFALTAPGVDVSVSSKANMLGAGIVQKVDAADMALFLSYKHYSGDVDLTSNVPGLVGELGVKDFSAVIVGTRINF